MQVAVRDALWYGSFKSAPGQLVLVREPGSGKPYDLGLFTLDTHVSAEAAAERYSWRWAIEPSNAAGKQLTGAGDACSRVQKAVERAVPFAFLIQSLMITWYAIACDPAAGVGPPPQRAPGTKPRSPHRPPTCTPRCAVSSPPPEFPASAQVRTVPRKTFPTP